MKSDIREDVATIIEGNDAETFLDGQRDAGFEVDDELFVAAAGNVDLRAIGSGLV